MRQDQTVKNLIFGDLEIPLVVIRVGVTELKKTGLVYLLDMFGGRGEEEWCDLVCKTPLDDWANVGSADAFFAYGEYGFSSVGIEGQICIALLHGSKMSAELPSRNLILGINWFTISTLNVYQWLNG